MTDTFEDDASEVTDTEYTPRKFSFWCLGGVFFAMLGSILSAFVEFWDEASVGFHRHALWKDAKRADKRIVSNFREQLAEL